MQNRPSRRCGKGELPTTIDVAEEQEMTRTNVVATWDGPINVFYTVGFTLEQIPAAGTFRTGSQSV